MCGDVFLISSVPISFLASSQLHARTEDCPFPHFPESCGVLALVTNKRNTPSAACSSIQIDERNWDKNVNGWRWWGGDHLPITTAGKTDLRKNNLFPLLLTWAGTAQTQDMPSAATWHPKMWIICTYSHGLGLIFKDCTENQYLNHLKPTVLAGEKQQAPLFCEITQGTITHPLFCTIRKFPIASFLL